MGASNLVENTEDGGCLHSGDARFCQSCGDNDCCPEAVAEDGLGSYEQGQV